MNATTSSTSRSADVAAIVAIVVAQETGFNSKDAEIFAAPWRDRSWAVSAAGREIAGRAAVLDAAEVGFAGPLRDEYVSYRPGDVEFLGDDVAILHVYARATTRDGEPIDADPSMIALYVFAREAGRWQIVARQNTLVSA
jgi:uncharacterized protein (TIGR02246 family)